MKSWPAAALLGLASCVPSGSPEQAKSPPPIERERAHAATRPAVSVEVLEVSNDAPPASDGAALHTLAFVYGDGRRVPIAEQAVSFVPFRDGVALVDRTRRLLLVSPDGGTRVLAQASGAPPALGPSGELVYVARQELVSEVHVLHASGQDRIVASGLASAGMLAPQRDGRLCFVGAKAGGVAGVYVVQDAGARCLSNCELKTGEPWGDAHVPLPKDASSIAISGTQVTWEAWDGTRRSAALAPGLPSGTGRVDALGGRP
jgi:hypothetical protein